MDSKPDEVEVRVTVELECLECHTQTRVDLSAEEFRSMSSSWTRAQQCEVCRKPTDWTFAEAAVGMEEQADFWDWLATTGALFESQRSERPDERRKERRLDLHVPLHIASADGEEEEVTSEDISKSGLCFVSHKTYQAGDRLRVTLVLPGAPRSVNAMIVRSTAAEQGGSLYGARIVD
jgi:hypothetical protein